jgi:hypothetical protein
MALSFDLYVPFPGLSMVLHVKEELCGAIWLLIYICMIGTAMTIQRYAIRTYDLFNLI